ncbi:MAG: glucose 1-dehydrogenase [Chthoniobacter sp.]|nr:glucose 1-dehydrogenase [Chthoniobacter sp.]
MSTSSNTPSFAEKVVLITGGTSGIGRATAVAFAQQGAHVVVSGRRATEGAESVTLIEQAGGKGLFVQSDVAREEDSASAVARTVAHFGRLDFAFNNAGISLPSGPVTEVLGEVFDQIFDINVRGVLFGMKYQIPAILQSGGGAIVNNASVLGLRAVGVSPVYNASKFAVIGLTQTTALQFATKGVRVNAVCPAITETDMTAGARADEGTHQRLLSQHPMGRFGRSEEIAAAVLFLCSPGASYITGISLPVDGGFTI